MSDPLPTVTATEPPSQILTPSAASSVVAHKLPTTPAGAVESESHDDGRDTKKKKREVAATATASPDTKRRRACPSALEKTSPPPDVGFTFAVQESAGASETTPRFGYFNPGLDPPLLPTAAAAQGSCSELRGAGQEMGIASVMAAGEIEVVGGADELEFDHGVECNWL